MVLIYYYLWAVKANEKHTESAGQWTFANYNH